MRMHEDFTRCECGDAWIEKKEYVTALYNGQGLQERPLKRTDYVCAGCKKIIHSNTYQSD